jgi:hypothetical protein
MTNPLTEMSGQQIDQLIGALDSLKDGDLAVDLLIACGRRAIPALALYLLKGRPRTVSLPRARAARALGELGAYDVLLAYFRDYERPQDAAVLFAEDSVRSAVAHELMPWKCDEVFRVLLDATKQRATEGLVQALGEFRRSQSIPVLFELLEDDLCRDHAMESLRKAPDAARQYGILAILGFIDVQLEGRSALVRRRAVLQLLAQLGVASSDWECLRTVLWKDDPGTVIAAAQLGFMAAPESDWPQIVVALLRVADKFNWVQEADALQLLDAHPDVARQAALQIAKHRSESGEHPNWMSPLWRILRHVLGHELDNGSATAP